MQACKISIEKKKIASCHSCWINNSRHFEFCLFLRFVDEKKKEKDDDRTKKKPTQKNGRKKNEIINLHSYFYAPIPTFYAHFIRCQFVSGIKLPSGNTCCGISAQIQIFSIVSFVLRSPLVLRLKIGAQDEVLTWNWIVLVKTTFLDWGRLTRRTLRCWVNYVSTCENEGNGNDAEFSYPTLHFFLTFLNRVLWAWH